MPYVPKPRHLLKVLLRQRDRAAAEGLFLEGSIEFQNGDLETAGQMFYFGARLDPTLAGNHFNYAVVLEKQNAPARKIRRAWQAYLKAAESDARQSEDQRAVARERLDKLK